MQVCLCATELPQGTAGLSVPSYPGRTECAVTKHSLQLSMFSHGVTIVTIIGLQICCAA